jgi:hypothetical protein
MKQKIYSLLICMLLLGSFSYPTTNACDKGQLCNAVKTVVIKENADDAGLPDFFPMTFFMFQ